MSAARLYAIWGALVLAGFGAVHVVGLAPWSTADEVKGIPRSIRDNPGAYRTHYVGGK